MSCPTLPVYSNEIDHSAQDTTKLNNYSRNTIFTVTEIIVVNNIISYYIVMGLHLLLNIFIFKS